MKQLASNMVEILNKQGVKILISYDTPVAGFDIHRRPFVTEAWYSRTTTRHIHKYFNKFNTIDSDPVRCTVDKIYGFYNGEEKIA